MNRMVSFLGTAALVTALWIPGASAVLAQETQSDPAKSEEQLTPKERRQQAKQERIDRYLKKKEEKQARKAAKKAEQEAAEQQAAAESGADEQVATQTAASTAAVDEPTPSGATEPGPEATAESEAVRMPKELAEAQYRLRRGPVGKDPDGRQFLDVIDSGDAMPRDFGEFGNFLARRGYTFDAVTYYRMALAGDPENESLWLNLGTVHLARDELNEAESAFMQILSRDPNHAFAHYNLSAVYRKARRYDEAVEALRRSLVLDPQLGDPKINPQAAINPLMVPVKLQLYQTQAGSLALPLQDIESDRESGR